jgi:hypothetical protein
MKEKSKKKMSWYSDAPEDDAIFLFEGFLTNPDVSLSRRARLKIRRRPDHGSEGIK